MAVLNALMALDSLVTKARAVLTRKRGLRPQLPKDRLATFRTPPPAVGMKFIESLTGPNTHEPYDPEAEILVAEKEQIDLSRCAFPRGSNYSPRRVFFITRSGKVLTARIVGTIDEKSNTVTLRRGHNIFKRTWSKTRPK